MLRISQLSFLLAAAASLLSTASGESFLVQIKLNSNSLGRRQANPITAQGVLESHLKDVAKIAQGGEASSNSNFRITGQFDGLGDTFVIGNFVGYSAEFSPSLAESVKALPGVSRVLPNSQVTTHQTGCIARPVDPDPLSGEWGLGRISHFQNTPDPYMATHNTYRFHPNSQCSNTTIYVLDSGISRNHPEFTGRTIRWGYQAVSTWAQDDTCGHGTHIAGIAAGRNYGVQSSSQLVAIKALDGPPGDRCTGSWSGVISGLIWAAEDARTRGILARSVLLMSLGGSWNQIVNDAVDNVVDAGLTVVVSAGNSAEDACLGSPASAKKVITVGNVNLNDEVSWSSNTGCCVDIFAPGEEIASAHLNNGYARLSGTSMAAPFVAGMVLYNKCMHGYTTPVQDKVAVTTKENVIRGKITQGDSIGLCTEDPVNPSNGECEPGVGGGCAPNRILYNRC
ncbi:subtilisin-like protein [Ascodesmis nigricans]|uniref:Subtilisin-like protein n=1 Tax=Ascodesmis nigricans TaxID=341454 RepID=A0A4S2MYM5_9PEZI|nr:subtilisin-like protein [Ascodesmis nigricans]